MIGFVILYCKQDKGVFGKGAGKRIFMLAESAQKIAFKTTSFISLEPDYIGRKLPSSLKEGEPNLLLVPKGTYQNTRFQSFNWQ